MFVFKEDNFEPIVNGDNLLTEKRNRYGGIYKLNLKSIKKVIKVNHLSKSDLLQLNHEIMGH